MTKVVCCPENLLPSSLDPQVLYFSMFSHSKRDNVGYFGLAVPRAIKSAHLAPSVAAWDFATFAFAVDAVDKAVLRDNSADGWTRMIDLTVFLINPTPWRNIKDRIEQTLRFLSGDFWTLTFETSTLDVPVSKKPLSRNADCVCLLSGGADSLVGAIDLTEKGKAPLFVSHIARGSGEAQRIFAASLGASDRHLKWSFASDHAGKTEPSTRARSLVFFAFAALGASAISTRHNNTVDIVVPENGFISLNVPLSPGRIGSLSTKTTHPIYMSGIQEIWDTLHIGATLKFPYRSKTKGELFSECTNQVQLENLLKVSVSCGKYQKHKLTHCGECVPCMIRRAAFLHANIADTTTKGYECRELRYSERNDVAAAANACIRFQTQCVRRFVGGALSFASEQDRSMYEGVVSRGMVELGALLSAHGVL